MVEEAVSLCDCGALARSPCTIGLPGITLTPCGRPVCSTDGRWCAVHRHAPGTMGYPGSPGAPMVGRADFQGFVPDGPGLWAWVLAFCSNHFTGARWKAQKCYARECAFFPPPAPLPDFDLRIGHRRFKNVGRRMVEVVGSAGPTDRLAKVLDIQGRERR